MDEQLEVAFEGAGMEDQSETPVSPGGEAGVAEEKGEEAIRQEEVNAVTTRGEAAPDAQRETSAYAPEQGLDRHTLPARQDAPSELNDGEGSSGKTGEILRNYYAEWQELAEAHPEVVGKELPEDIYQACMRSELPPIRVYESMMLRKQAEQISALQQEIAALRQNAENTARAPVSGSAGSPENEPEDLFLGGFNSY